jgi:PAS domain S-box-containing protein
MKLSIMAKRTPCFSEILPIAGSTGGENPMNLTGKPAFQTLALNIPGIVYRVYVREQNRMEFFNDMLEKVTGYKPGELRRGEVCSIDPMIISDDHLRVIEAVKNAVRESKPFEVEYRITHKNGGIRYFLERGQPIYGSDGKPEFIDGVILDITDRKRSELALGESEERFRSVLENSLDAIYRRNLKTTQFDYLSPAFGRVTGFAPDELRAMGIDEVLQRVHPDDRPQVSEGFKHISKCGKGLLEYRFMTKDGGYRWLAVTLSEVRDKEGNPSYRIGVIRDITASKQTEKALLFKENIINSSSSIIATCDLEGHMIYGNPSFLKTWGFDDSQEFLGRPFWEFWLVEDRLDEIMPALRGAGTWFGEIKAIRKDGSTFDVRVSAATVFDSEGNPVALTSTSIDITERKRAEEALREARDELELRVTERTGELELKNKELQDFAFVASHDLAEPLRKVQTFGRLLNKRCMEGVFDEVSKDYIARMRSATARMQNLLNSLLAYSRVTTKADPMKKWDLRESVKEALSDLEIVMAEKNADVEIGDLPTVRADGVQMTQLFENLIGNALKFHRQGEAPRVKIYAKELEDAFEIYVEDNGIGFDEQYLEKIFLPFQRLHGRSSEYEGVGMGLAICKKIVERHGGKIRATSESGKGSTFIVTLPEKPKKG